ncbi:MAG: hypothetical protein Q8M71_00645, partial [Thermodesulfovibrionales bacterium]|nr:hypothetical protein [Thermodesulfovibrionales bacterium]
NIFFQGGVAFNKSVVAAFEKYLNTKITVPTHHDVTGAIGMALIARDYIKERSAFSVQIPRYPPLLKGGVGGLLLSKVLNYQNGHTMSHHLNVKVVQMYARLTG